MTPICALQSRVDDWIKTIGIRYFSELTNMAILTEEVGEVARLMSRMYGDQSFKDSKDEVKAKEYLGEELSDVMFVVLCLANQTGIDLDQAFEKKMIFKSERDQNRHRNNPKLYKP